MSLRSVTFASPVVGVLVEAAAAGQDDERDLGVAELARLLEEAVAALLQKVTCRLVVFSMRLMSILPLPGLSPEPVAAGCSFLPCTTRTRISLNRNRINKQCMRKPLSARLLRELWASTKAAETWYRELSWGRRRCLPAWPHSSP